MTQFPEDDFALLEALDSVRRRRHPYAPCANYKRSGTYSPQWQCSGNLYWYRLPSGEVLAIRGPNGLIVSSSDMSPLLQVLRS